MHKRAIYFDYNATAPLRPEAQEGMAEAWKNWGNASSIHSFGRRAKSLLEKARQQIALFLGEISPQRIIFTASATEANNMILRDPRWAHIFVNTTEHDSVLAALPPHHTCLSVNADGLISLENLENLLSTYQKTHSDKACLVSIQAANSETGICQDFIEIGRLCHLYGAYYHCDAVQYLGKLPFTLADTHIDYLTLSSHKMGGPLGVGACVLAAGREITAFLRGGGQEMWRRAGTENIPALYGFAALLRQYQIQDMENCRALRDMLEDEIMQKAPDTKIFGKNTQRLPNTSLMAMPAMTAQTQLIHFDLGGFAVSAGSACSSGKVDTSHVLRAMKVEPIFIENAIRISLGPQNTLQEIKDFAKSWLSLYKKQAQNK